MVPMRLLNGSLQRFWAACQLGLITWCRELSPTGGSRAAGVIAEWLSGRVCLFGQREVALEIAVRLFIGILYNARHGCSGRVFSGNCLGRRGETTVEWSGGIFPGDRAKSRNHGTSC